MSHKSALQQIAAMDDKPILDDRELELERRLARAIFIAREALAEPTGADAKKLAQDQKKANAAIAVLENLTNNPTRLLLSSTSLDRLPTTFMPAVAAELARMQRAVGDPELLKSIYRRNEVRR